MTHHDERTQETKKFIDSLKFPKPEPVFVRWQVMLVVVFAAFFAASIYSKYFD